MVGSTLAQEIFVLFVFNHSMTKFFKVNEKQKRAGKIGINKQSVNYWVQTDFCVLYDFVSK